MVDVIDHALLSPELLGGDVEEDGDEGELVARLRLARDHGALTSETIPRRVSGNL